MKSTTKKLIKENVSHDAITFHKDGTFTVKHSYFYRHGMTTRTIAEKAMAQMDAIGIHATEVDSGDHFHAFVGGAKSGSAQDSYMWVKFTVED